MPAVKKSSSLNFTQQFPNLGQSSLFLRKPTNSCCSSEHGLETLPSRKSPQSHEGSFYWTMSIQMADFINAAKRQMATWISIFKSCLRCAPLWSHQIFTHLAAASAKLGSNRTPRVLDSPVNFKLLCFILRS